jgi:hypothetical protein
MLKLSIYPLKLTTPTGKPFKKDLKFDSSFLSLIRQVQYEAFYDSSFFINGVKRQCRLHVARYRA